MVGLVNEGPVMLAIVLANVQRLLLSDVSLAESIPQLSIFFISFDGFIQTISLNNKNLPARKNL